MQVPWRARKPRMHSVQMVPSSWSQEVQGKEQFTVLLVGVVVFWAKVAMVRVELITPRLVKPGGRKTAEKFAVLLFMQMVSLRAQTELAWNERTVRLFEVTKEVGKTWSNPVRFRVVLMFSSMLLYWG